VVLADNVSFRAFFHDKVLLLYLLSGSGGAEVALKVVLVEV